MITIKKSIIIPAYNEEEAIVKTIDGVKNVINESYEVLVIDDGSSDNTYELAKSCGVKVLRHEMNKGKAAAIATGIESASGEIITTIDADCTYEAEAIPKLVELVEKGADLAIGSRFLGQIEGMRLLNKIGNKIFSNLISLFVGQKNTDAQSGLRCFRKDLFRRLIVEAKGLDFETEMTSRALKEGYKVVEIPIKYRERVGESKLNPFVDGYRMLRALLRGTRPLDRYRRYLLRKVMKEHIEPNTKVLYIGSDGGSLVSHLVGVNTIHYYGIPQKSIPKGLVWLKEPEKDYDFVVMTDLTEVEDDIKYLQLANKCLKNGGKIIIWLPNPNAHALLSWLMLLRLLGPFEHIRYYTMGIQKLLLQTNFKMVLFKRCNLHVNILVIGEKEE
ncbi:MAG: glycosyltransferase [Methanocellales archaeon]|nr:glycosyltransferase [Methanocellales archaeon]